MSDGKKLHLNLITKNIPNKQSGIFEIKNIIKKYPIPRKMFLNISRILEYVLQHCSSVSTEKRVVYDEYSIIKPTHHIYDVKFNFDF